jgi:hypothetical protein
MFAKREGIPWAWSTSELGRIETGSLVVFLLAERAPSEGPRPSAQSKIDQAAR